MEEFNVSPRASNSHAKAARDRAMAAHARIQADLDSLTADMQDLSNQVGPVTEQAEERHHREQAVQLLSAQRDRMFRALVARARTVASSLGMANPNVPVEGNSDIAAYLMFFDELLQWLEGAAAEFENMIDKASRNLLAVAVERIFSNLRRLQPDLDLETVMA